MPASQRAGSIDIQIAAWLYKTSFISSAACLLKASVTSAHLTAYTYLQKYILVKKVTACHASYDT